MKERKKPTSTLLHERNRLAAELYRACAEGHVKDVRKLKPKFITACKVYLERFHEDERVKAEKLARQEERKRKREQKLQRKQRKSQ